MTDFPMCGLILMKETGLLRHVVPELERGIGLQNQAHMFDVWEHNLRVHFSTLQTKVATTRETFCYFFHDISKPETKRFSKREECHYVLRA